MLIITRWVLTILIATWFAVVAAGAWAASASRDHWVATWTATLEPPGSTPVTVRDQTIRQVMRVSVGGPRIRIHLSNEFGSRPLVVGAMSVGLIEKNGDLIPRTSAPIRFDGLSTVVVSPGARVISDPADLKTAALQDIAVSLYLPEETPLSTVHIEDHRPYDQRGYLPSSTLTPAGALLSSAGDFTTAVKLPPAAQKADLYPPFISAIDTVAPQSTPVVVILADTKSEGPDFWPNFVRDRISPPSGGGIAIANQAQYAGTLTLHRPPGTGLTRFDRDVLAVSGATHVLLFNGSNDVVMPGFTMDISNTVSSETIIFAMKQVAERSRTAGMKVIGATLVPFGGVTVRKGYDTPEHLRMRNEINTWIKTSGMFDAVVDFDAAVRDPKNPEHLLPAFDSGNHFTPSEAGMRAMADTVKAELFR